MLYCIYNLINNGNKKMKTLTLCDTLLDVMATTLEVNRFKQVISLQVNRFQEAT